MAAPRTLVQKIWDDHLVASDSHGSDLLYVDLHILHEVTSPQAFDGLRAAGRTVRRPDLTLATEDHNVPTLGIDRPIADQMSRKQIEALRRNAAEFGVALYSMGDPRQGIVHVIAPEQGLSQPGMTIVCGDSHTSTHGAFGALAFGIGTSEVEHVLATQTLRQSRPKDLVVTVQGTLNPGVSAKDLALHLISIAGSAGGQGAIVEYRGEAIDRLSMDGRMTLCNLSIEWGARAGLIAPDDVTLEYLHGRAGSPVGSDWDDAVEYWSCLRSDAQAHFDDEIVIEAGHISPRVSWGTTPAQSVPLSGSVPQLPGSDRPEDRAAAERALDYMQLSPGTPLKTVAIDVVFLGSCTNGRLEDLRDAARVLRGRQLAPGTRMLVVPGSMSVKSAAEKEGLAHIFVQAGAEWRASGCSMCPGMNPDHPLPGQRSASTSNRNFEGRQGLGVMTHLVSPTVAAATAVAGRLAEPADLG